MTSQVSPKSSVISIVDSVPTATILLLGSIAISFMEHSEGIGFMRSQAGFWADTNIKQKLRMFRKMITYFIGEFFVLHLYSFA